MDHYRRLGVRRTASTSEIRTAYRSHARRLHPDRRAGDDRAMQDLNEAWRVLRDPARRRAYDATLSPHRRPPSGAFDGGDEVFMPDPPVDVRISVLRNLPWALVLAVLAAIFIFTAVARSPEESPERQAEITAGECVVPQPGVGATEASCTHPRARQVVSVPGDAQPCPTGTDRFEAASLPRALCLDRPQP